MKKILNFLLIISVVVNAQRNEELILDSYQVININASTREYYDINKKTEKIDISNKNIKLFVSEGPNFLVLNGIESILSTGGFEKISQDPNTTANLDYIYEYSWVGGENQGSCIVKWFENQNTYVCITQKSIWEFTLGKKLGNNNTKPSLPKPIGYINDFENIFSNEEIKNLEEKVSFFEELTTNQIAIVSIDSLGSYTDFDRFALDLSKEWGVGLKDKDNGLTIVFSKKLQRIRINTGIGTEKILTDEFIKKVIDEFIIPKFQRGNYYDGIEKGLKEIMKEWI